ncbi:MAG TPA: diguanylate cyclase [Luteimonas sp.]|nr:diguanylate cyclase [Luteimonas sp.]
MHDPPSRFRRFRAPAFWLCLALVVGIGVASVAGVRDLQRSNQAVEHSYQTIRLIETVERELRTTEANARAYRLTSDEGYRERYLDAFPRVHESALALVNGTAGDPSQQLRAERLRELVETRLSDMHALFELQERSDAETAQAATRAASVLGHWSAIDAIERELRDHETSLLRERQSTSARRTGRLVAFILAGMLSSVVLMVALTRSLSRENRLARHLQREAAAAIEAMRLSSARRDHLSEQRHELSRYAGMLQSCGNRDEIMQLTAATLRRLVPRASGQCYVLRPSHDFYESVAAFGDHVVSSGDLLQAQQCWALRRGQAHYLRDGRDGMRCGHIDREARLDGLACLCVPLVAQGTQVGLLHVSAPASGDPEDSDAAIIALLAEQLGLALANTQLRETLQQQSLRDPLTGLFNRRYLEENLSRELHRCERRGLPLSVLMLDVDHFKRFNDTHGHAAGDALLAHVGRTIAGSIRAEDMACRYGGEEFTVILPETDAATAHARAETIRRALESTAVVHLRQTLGPVTASIGLSTWPDDGTTPELLLQVADAWLYRAKAEGRNRVLPALE